MVTIAFHSDGEKKKANIESTFLTAETTAFAISTKTEEKKKDSRQRKMKD